MKLIVATTTINPPTEALLKYAAFKDIHVVVSGDLKTDSSLFQNLDNVTYLTPEKQEKDFPVLSELIGWKCIQRRNFAILEAYKQGADLIAVIDDDNIPYDDWVENVVVGKEVEVNHYQTNDIAFDSIGMFYPTLWHRGFPLTRVSQRDYSDVSKKNIIPQIQEVMWDGDPDIDAISRMICNNPQCHFDSSKFPISSNAPSPMNSQNTIINAKHLKDYFLFPHVGRMDDIWASIHFQSCGHAYVHTKPGVLSDRTLGTTGRYTTTNDFQKEILGIIHTEDMLGDLKKDPSLIHKYLPERSSKAFTEWRQIINSL